MCRTATGCGRILCQGSSLKEETKLDMPDVQLVLLSFSVPASAQAEELVTAARHGFVAQVEAQQRGRLETARLLLEAGAQGLGF